jgi:hypothetical protein
MTGSEVLPERLMAAEFVLWLAKTVRESWRN